MKTTIWRTACLAAVCIAAMQTVSAQGYGDGAAMGPGMMGSGAAAAAQAAPGPGDQVPAWMMRGYGGGYGPGMMRGGYGGGYGGGMGPWMMGGYGGYPGMMGGYGGYGMGPGMMGGYPGMMGGYGAYAGMGPGMMAGWGYGPGSMMGGYGGDAGFGPGMMGHGWGRGGFGIDLSAEQRKKVDAIERAEFDKMWALMQSMHGLMLGAREQAFGNHGDIDVDATMKNAKAFSDLHLQMMRIRLEAAKQELGVLTSAQKASLFGTPR